MRSMIPPDIAEDDFQSYPLWREFNYSMLSYLSDTYQDIIIVPMTITNDQYFHDMISRLRQDGDHSPLYPAGFKGNIAETPAHQSGRKKLL